MWMTRPTAPVPVTTVVADVERFSRLTNPEQLAAHEWLYALFGHAFDAAGIALSQCGQEDRGDGVLVVVPATVPRPSVVDGLLGHLSVATGWPRPDGRPPIRLRVAAHCGDVHHDGRGFVGAEVNHTFRLVESPVLRRALARTRGNCAILVSDALYQGTARHGYGTLSPRRFHPAPVEVKETRTVGWLWVPGDDGCADEVAAAERDGQAERARPAPVGGGVRLDAGGDMRISGGVIAGRDAHLGPDAHPGRRRRGRRPG